MHVGRLSQAICVEDLKSFPDAVESLCREQNCQPRSQGGIFIFHIFLFQFIREGDPSTNWLIYKGSSI